MARPIPHRLQKIKCIRQNVRLLWVARQIQPRLVVPRWCQSCMNASCAWRRRNHCVNGWRFIDVCNDAYKTSDCLSRMLTHAWTCLAWWAHSYFEVCVGGLLGFVVNNGTVTALVVCLSLYCESLNIQCHSQSSGTVFTAVKWYRVSPGPGINDTNQHKLTIPNALCNRHTLFNVWLNSLTTVFMQSFIWLFYCWICIV